MALVVAMMAFDGLIAVPTAVAPARSSAYMAARRTATRREVTTGDIALKSFYKVWQIVAPYTRQTTTHFNRMPSDEEHL